MLLAHILKPYVRAGTLHLVDAKGEKTSLYGALPGPEVTLHFKDRATPWRILWNPKLAIGEAYMDGTMTVEGGDIYPLFQIYFKSIFHAMRERRNDLLPRVIEWMRRMMAPIQSLSRAKRNVAHHYDIGNNLYRLFLDQDMQYSCALFEKDDDSLEEAQENKKRHIAAKLLLKKGQKVLDIGSGWGGMALYLAQQAQVSVKGVTLSEQQVHLAAERAKHKFLADTVQFELQDYRNESAKYDRIVSVGMFEHVGAKNYGEFFAKIYDLLEEDGVMLLHTIGRMDGAGLPAEWINKYIFPGGQIPALSQIAAAVERQKLFITDIEVWRLQYARTLKEWRHRFQSRRGTAEALYDARFCRMWDFYLASCQASFEEDSSVVFQIQIAKKRDTVPQTRNYIEQWKTQHPNGRFSPEFLYRRPTAVDGESGAGDGRTALPA